MACEGKCTIRGVRTTYWCGFSNSESGEDLHGPHDWYSYVYREYLHCYGTDDSTKEV